MTFKNNQKGQLLSIIIPVYNDAEALSVFLPQLLGWITLNAFTAEIIIVDDGSKDDIESVFSEYKDSVAATTRVSLIRLSRNFGKEAALSAGLEKSLGDAVVMMDGDGQHSIAVLEQMLSLFTKDIDVVAAVQENRDNESRLAKFLKKGFYLFIQDKQRYEVKANAGDFRLMSRKVVDALIKLPERQRFMKGLYAWVGFNTVYMPFVADERQSGESKFNYGGLFELAITGITSFSQKPLRWIMRMGMLVSLLSFLYGIFIIFDTLIFGKDTPGWATIAAGMMFSTGIQLICIGVIGEYVGRIYEEVKQRPLYIVDKVIEDKDDTGKINDYDRDNGTNI